MDELSLQDLYEECLEEFDRILDNQDINIFNVTSICLLCNKQDLEDDLLVSLQTKLEEELELPVSLIDYEMVESDLYIESGCIIPTLHVEDDEALYY